MITHTACEMGSATQRSPIQDHMTPVIGADDEHRIPIVLGEAGRYSGALPIPTSLPSWLMACSALIISDNMFAVFGALSHAFSHPTPPLPLPALASISFPASVLSPAWRSTTRRTSGNSLRISSCCAGSCEAAPRWTRSARHARRTSRQRQRSAQQLAHPHLPIIPPFARHSCAITSSISSTCTFSSTNGSSRWTTTNMSARRRRRGGGDAGPPRAGDLA